ncbi:ragulator complex protein LAMTOR1 isoform X2 [Bacillus rossius redtenbacheri]|uniref:ragulator complex protein LAMTOR1 isoform X2 n=1 Tax=Bacillus rossius redtenbacheri TaxID=93214 RepID=UPI002FDC9C96
MGCCYSCKDEGSSQGPSLTEWLSFVSPCRHWFNCCEDQYRPKVGDPNEQTRLLQDPVQNVAIPSDDFIPRYPNSLSKKTDEQSALTRILQKTASSVIDVAALESHTLEQHDFLDRVRQYSQRLQSSGRWAAPARAPCLLADIPAPEKLLAAEPLGAADLQLITAAVKKCNMAISSITVDHKEDLVVPFRIP